MIVVYKFISKNVDWAVDDTGALLLNSANFIILRSGGVLKELGEQYVCEALKSDRMKQFHRLKFGGVIKVLKGNLGKLPIWIATHLSELLGQGFILTNVTGIFNTYFGSLLHC